MENVQTETKAVGRGRKFRIEAKAFHRDKARSAKRPPVEGYDRRVRRTRWKEEQTEVGEI